MKTCFICGVEKQFVEFYKHKGMRDGLLNKCKDCTREGVRKNRKENIEYYRKYDAERYRLDPRVRQRIKEYAMTDSGKKSQAKAKEKWASRNKEKRAAHVLLGNAVRDNRVAKPSTCQSCGSGGRIDGHHDDYAKPLDVTWLCRQCHVDVHKGI